MLMLLMKMVMMMVLTLMIALMVLMPMMLLSMPSRWLGGILLMHPYLRGRLALLRNIPCRFSHESCVNCWWLTSATALRV